MTERRLKIYQFSKEALLELFTEGDRIDSFELTLEGLPVGSVAIEVRWGFEYEAFEVKVFNPAFEIVPECGVIPRAAVVLHSRRKAPKKKRNAA